MSKICNVIVFNHHRSIRLHSNVYNLNLHSNTYTNIHAIMQASPNGKNRPATARKLNSSFRSFLHEATGFYCSFIQKLAVHFELEQLDPIVKKFGLTKGKER